MKKIGIVGGIGPESTLDYYRSITRTFGESFEVTGYPEIAIESIDLRIFNALVAKGDWDSVVRLISSRCENLRQCGAEIGAIASNTPHAAFDAIQAKTGLRLLSILTATCDYARTLNVRSLLLLGTRFTMTSDYYQKAFDSYGIRLTVPDSGEIERVHHVLMKEVEFGIIREESRADLLSIIARIRRVSAVEGVILGCTELPLILSQNDIEIHCINPSSLHVDALIRECRT